MLSETDTPQGRDEQLFMHWSLDQTGMQCQSPIFRILERLLYRNAWLLMILTTETVSVGVNNEYTLPLAEK